MGICEVLTIIFVVCKLLGIVTWSWWLVFLPEIIAVVAYIFAFVCFIKNITKDSKKWIDKL